MATLHLVLSKHPNPAVGRVVSGERFLRRRAREIIQRGRKPLYAISEDNFVGFDQRYCRRGIRKNTALRQELKRETRWYKERILDPAVAAVNKGETTHVGMVLGAEIEETNRQHPNQIELRASASDEEGQLLTLEALAWRNDGYLAAYNQGAKERAIDHLVQSVHLMARAVKHRGDLLEAQIDALWEEKSGSDFLVWQGSNHRELGSRAWGMELQLHLQPDEPYSFYDEVLIRLSMGEEPANSDMRQAMDNELGFNDRFIALLRQAAPEISVEDLMRMAKQQTGLTKV